MYSTTLRKHNIIVYRAKMGDTNSTHVGSLILSTCKKWDQKYYVTICIESNKDKFGHVGCTKASTK